MASNALRKNAAATTGRRVLLNMPIWQNGTTIHNPEGNATQRGFEHELTEETEFETTR
jgi:hypothetical protein